LLLSVVVDECEVQSGLEMLAVLHLAETALQALLLKHQAGWR
jgi:hypothetical protein